MHETSFFLNAISSMVTADSESLQLVVEHIAQRFPGPHSQPVSAEDAEAVIGQIISAHLSALPHVAVPRSRQAFAIQECRKQLAKGAHVSPRRLIFLALLLCPGESEVKQQMLLLMVPAAEEVTMLPMSPAAASLSAALTDIFPTMHSVVCVHAVFSGNSALLPKLFEPEREHARTALFTGILTSAVAALGNEELSARSIARLVAAVKSAMMEVMIATAETRCSQPVLAASLERHVRKLDSRQSSVNFMPSFRASFGSVDVDEKDATGSTAIEGESALLNVLQKYTRDKAALLFLLSSATSSNKGSRGSTSDFLDSSSRLYSASNSQQSNAAAAHAPPATASFADTSPPQATGGPRRSSESPPHHYTPRDMPSTAYPAEESGSANSGNGIRTTRLETQSADTDPSRTGATDSSIRHETFNVNTAKIRTPPAQTPPAVGRRSQIDGIRGSGSAMLTPGQSASPPSTDARAAAGMGAERVPEAAPAAASHFGGHFRGRSLGGDTNGDGIANTSQDSHAAASARADEAARRSSDTAYASRSRSPVLHAHDGSVRTAESLPYAVPAGSLTHAPSAVPSAAASHAGVSRRDILGMSAVPRVQEGSPKVHVPYSTSPSDHVHLGDHTRMAIAMSGTLTASSHPLSNAASSPRSQLAPEAVTMGSRLPPDAAAAMMALAATSSDAAALQRTLQKQVSHGQGHPFSTLPARPTNASASPGDVFAMPAAWEQQSMLGSDTGAVGGTPASQKMQMAPGEGLHGTLLFGTFRRGASGDELNGVSLRPDGQAIHVTSATEHDQATPQAAKSTRLSHRMRRMASRVPFVRTQIRQQDVPEVTFFSQTALPPACDAAGLGDMTSPQGSRTTRLGVRWESGRSGRQRDGGGGGTVPLAARGRTLTKSASFAGGKLPVVTSKAMAMAAVNRQLTVTAPQDTHGVKTLASVGQSGLPTSASAALLDRLLRDTQQQVTQQPQIGGSMLLSPTSRTPGHSLAASELSAPAALCDMSDAGRMPHSSPGSLKPRRSSANISTRPSIDGGLPAALRAAAVSQPLPGTGGGALALSTEPATQSSFDNVFSPQPVSPADSVPPIHETEPFPTPRHASGAPTEGGVSISVNGAISAKSPDTAQAEADAGLAETTSGTGEASPDWPRRSPTFGPHHLSGHLAASMESMAAHMHGSRGASSGSSPAAERTRARMAAAPPPPTSSRKRPPAAPDGRRRSSDDTASPPDVPTTPTTTAERTGGDGATLTSSDRASSGAHPPTHGSNFSFGRSSQDPAVLLAADAVLWSAENTLGSVDAQLTTRSASVDPMHESGGTKGLSVTLARRLEHQFSRSMPARHPRASSKRPAAPAAAATPDLAVPAQPDGLSQQWDRVATGTISSTPSTAHPDDPSNTQTRTASSRDGSPESLHLPEPFLLPQPPASAGLSGGPPVSHSATSSLFQDAAGTSFRTATSATSSFQSHSPRSDAVPSSGPLPATPSGPPAATPAAAQAHLLSSLDSHGSSSPSGLLAPSIGSVYNRSGLPGINTGPFSGVPGQTLTPRDPSPAARHLRSLSDALREEMAVPHSHLPYGAHQVAFASPTRSAATGVADESEQAVQTLLQDMQLQVDLAAAATDNELRVQAERHEAAKAEVDPIKAVTSMAAVLGGKFFLLQGVRLILSVCLLVSSVAGFFALLQYTPLNVALSLTIVVGVNVCLAGVLLLIIIMKGPNQNGLGDLLRPSGNAGASSSLQAVLPTFHPVIKDAFQSIMKPSQDGGGAASQGGGGGQGEATGGSARTARGGRTAASGGPKRVPKRASITPRGMPLPTIDPHALQRAVSPAEPPPASTRTSLARGSVAATGERQGGGVLSRVVDTGTAIMNRLPPKHRESQVGRIARGLLMELKDHSHHGGQSADGGAVAEGGRSRDENGAARQTRSFTGPAPEIRAMPAYEWS
eukprot:jgi/Ulvmu1/648/UM010_0018.1